MNAAELPLWYIRVVAFVFGALWGSFANVLIYRWPRELSVVSPPSHCFSCKTPVKPYDNVPVFAWLWLRGKCRHCGAKFSARYPLVEALFGLASLAIAERIFHSADAHTLSAAAGLAHYGSRFAVVFALGVTALIDLDEMLVPWFTKWFAVAPLLCAALLGGRAPTVDLLTSVAGAAVGYLGLRLLFIDGFKALTGRAGMGLGDAEVLLLVGALLGPAGVLFTLGAGALQGVIATVIATAFGLRVGPDFADDVDDLDDEEEETERDSERAQETLKETTPNDDGAPQTTLESVGSSDGAESDAPRKTPVKVPFVPFLSLAAIEYLLGADALVTRWLGL